MLGTQRSSPIDEDLLPVTEDEIADAPRNTELRSRDRREDARVDALTDDNSPEAEAQT
jgi:hypothetical protein